MAAPQNIIGIVYDYDQTLSPTYMQDEVLFPKFGINPAEFWKRCRVLVEEQGFESELAYLKAMIDYLEMDGPSNDNGNSDCHTKHKDGNGSWIGT